MKRMPVFGLVLSTLLCAAKGFSGYFDEAEAQREKKLGIVAERILLEEGKRGKLAREEKDALREEIRELDEKLEAMELDWRSFYRVRGRCKDIHGDWFFDGPWMVNTFYRRILRVFDVPRHIRGLLGKPLQADDVTPSGEVLDSAFYFRQDVARIDPSDLAELVRRDEPKFPVTITGEKKEGKSAGFYGKDAKGRDYIFITDPAEMEEQVTGAEVVGALLMKMIGYNVPVSAIVTLSGTGDSDFDGKRAVATKLIPGYSGHWTYRDFGRRRELRASRVFAAWMHNTDQVDHNTGISVISMKGAKLTNYYIFDFGGSLGSWNIRPKEPRDGWEYYVDPLHPAWMRYLFGLKKRPYPKEGKPFSPAVGYFDTNVNPDRYMPNYPIMAWLDMTEEDALWAAAILQAFRADQVRKAVELARYSDPASGERIYESLMERRGKILAHYGLAAERP